MRVGAPARAPYKVPPASWLAPAIDQRTGVGTNQIFHTFSAIFSLSPRLKMDGPEPRGECLDLADVSRNRAARISQLIDCGLKGRLEGGGYQARSRALVKGVRFFGHQCRLNILGPGAPADCARGFLGEIFF